MRTGVFLAKLKKMKNNIYFLVTVLLAVLNRLPAIKLPYLPVKEIIPVISNNLLCN